MRETYIEQKRKKSERIWDRETAIETRLASGYGTLSPSPLPPSELPLLLQLTKKAGQYTKFLQIHLITSRKGNCVKNVVVVIMTVGRPPENLGFTTHYLYDERMYLYFIATYEDTIIHVLLTF